MPDADEKDLEKLQQYLQYRLGQEEGGHGLRVERGDGAPYAFTILLDMDHSNAKHAIIHFGEFMTSWFPHDKDNIRALTCNYHTVFRDHQANPQNSMIEVGLTLHKKPYEALFDLFSNDLEGLRKSGIVAQPAARTAAAKIKRAPSRSSPP